MNILVSNFKRKHDNKVLKLQVNVALTQLVESGYMVLKWFRVLEYKN